MIKNVTLIGLGSMGTGVAQNILKAGFDLTVYNRTVAKTDPFAKLGARVAASTSEAAQNEDLIIRLAEEVAAPLTTGNAACEVYRMAGKLGFDDAEFSAVFEVFHHEESTGS